MMQRREMVIRGARQDESFEAGPGKFGRLDILDEIYNALHGVGDVDGEIKSLIVSLVEDIHTGSRAVLEACQDQADRDNIIKVRGLIISALKNKPKIANAVLGRWLDEVTQKTRATI